MEQLREENHKLTLKLENLKKTHATECEYLREEADLKDKEFRVQVAKLRDEAKSREELKNEKLNALTEELNSLREEHDSALHQIEKLRSQVEIVKSAKSAGSCSTYSEYEGLKETNRTLKSQLVEKDEILTSHAEKIRVLSEQLRECKRAVSDLTEEVEGKDAGMKEMAARVRSVEVERDEEVGVLQNEVVSLKEEVKELQGRVAGLGGAAGGSGGKTGGANTNDSKKQGDRGGATTTNSRGNSLFSEVEERRIKVEGELTRLRALVKKLSEEKRALQLEVERGDSHQANITTQLEVITKNENELQKEFKKDKSEMLHMFDFYRQRLEQLRSQYIRKLEQYKCSGLVSSAQATSELETLRSDRDKLQLLNISKERENNELKRELKYNKHLRGNAEANMKILKAKLDFAKNQAQQQGQAPQQTPDSCNGNLNLLNDIQNIATAPPRGPAPDDLVLNSSILMQESPPWAGGDGDAAATSTSTTTPLRSKNVLVRNNNHNAAGDCNQQ